MSPQTLSSTRRSTGLAALAPQAAPCLAAPLCGLLAHRVFAGFGRSGAVIILERALPGSLARLAERSASQPLIPALLAACVPVAAWLFLSAWASGVQGISRGRARRAVGWVWWASVTAAAAALLAGVSEPKPGLAALGYALTCPALASLAVALHLRRAGAQAFALGLSAAALVCLLARLLPLGWPGQNSWTWWPMLPARPLPELLSGVAWVAAAWLALLALSRLESRWPRRWAVVGLVLVPLMLARGFAHFEAYGPEKHPAALASEINTSYFQMIDGVRNPAEYLRHFAELSDHFPMHGATHPAGWPLLFRAAADAGGTPAGAIVASGVARILGADPARARGLASDVLRHPLTDSRANALWILVGLMLGALMALPAAVYFAARAHEAPRIAFRAAGLAAVLASPLLFFPDVDLLYPAVAVLGAGAWMRSERRGSPGWALLAGTCLAALSIFSFGNLALYGVFGLQAVLCWRRRQARAWPEARRAALLLAPLALVWTCAAALGHDPWAVLEAALRHHRDTLAGRSRLLWTALNLPEFALLMSLPVAAWLLRATPWWHHPDAARKLRMDPEAALFGATVLMLIALNFSGTTKGEAGRLWMSFMPLLVAGGAALWRERRRAEWAWLCGASLVLAAVLKGFYVFIWIYSG